MTEHKKQNITEHLYGHAEIHPEKAAFLHPQRLSFNDLIREIDRFADGFRKQGIGAGTRTIVLITPGIDLFAVCFALFRLGALPVMIDPGMGRKRMVHALEGVDAEAFVGIPRSHLLRILFPGTFKTIRIWISTGFSLFRETSSLESMPYVNTRSKAFPVGADYEAALFFTSGSTGAPKGVVYTSGMLEAQIEILRGSFGYTPEETDLCTFPILGFILISMGISIVLADMDMGHPSTLNPRKLIKNIRDHSCTHMFCSPMVLKRLAEYGKKKKIKISSLKRIMTAGAPVFPSILKDFRTLLAEDAEIHTPYGATEALLLTDIADNELLELYKDSESLMEGICVGYPLKGIEMKIMSITDLAVSSLKEVLFLDGEEVGEILVTGPNVSKAYWKNRQGNDLAKVRDENPNQIWHRTGDLGRMDSEGRLWFYGRKSQRVVHKAKIYFTIPVEAVFNRHPSVARSALVGVEMQDKSDKIPVICLELVKNRKRKIYLYEELRSMASEFEVAGGISNFLIHNKFPVDPRHNAKIFREKLSDWARVKMKL